MVMVTVKRNQIMSTLSKLVHGVNGVHAWRGENELFLSFWTLCMANGYNVCLLHLNFSFFSFA